MAIVTFKPEAVIISIEEKITASLISTFERISTQGTTEVCDSTNALPLEFIESGSNVIYELFIKKFH
ncbi:hypothetical protein PH4_000080 [Escherichia phage PH4]|nr:hypothetical protein PC3_000080 [Escherichia phage PC3]URX66058.1 hypothetical protein PH4_000080 [Escherichia phage PH4]